MKKTLLILIATSAALLSVNTKTLAQQNGTIAAITNDKNIRTSPMDQSATVVNSNLANKKMSMRALKDFSKSFKNANNADWFVTETGGFVASFKENELKNSAYYNQKGQFMYSIKRYAEQDLPKSIRHIVKSSYYDYSILGVEEVGADSRTIYLVHIQDEHTSKTIRIADGEMDVIEELVH
ncbi:hypothetical protein BH10BAC3_BH10BAC3_26170 [soil metagenome]